MSDRSQRPGRLLSPREREHIRNRLRMNQAQAKGKIVIQQNRATGQEGMDARRMGRMEEALDPSQDIDTRLAKEIKRDRELLERSQPADITAGQRADIERRAKENRDWLQAHMCPRSLYYLKSDHPDFQRATAAAMQEHAPEYKKRADQFKQDMRQLDPENENASNMEQIRPS